ncbi:zinc-ribbon domain-containing protein [Desulfitobacterium sp. PCE1]|uniref:zinc-ribbon domain-containing protein n=1 Tax=Desulfitobacterium sp. PCE1 TaxID=146907 RepID=UPI00037C0A9F|nr:zinc-ribbon domain-containing protein [Desulfitobacterium sp. PCE1]
MSKKKIIAELSAYFHLEGYELLSADYVNAHTKLDIKCNKGHVYQATWNSFQQGRRCFICAHQHIGKCNANSHEEFINRLKDKTNGSCIALSDYVSNSKKVLFKNINCGHTFEASPKHVLAGHTCPVCGYSRIGDLRRKTHEQYVEEVKALVGDEYRILGEYKGDVARIRFEHVFCGREFSMRAGNFLQGVRCPHCAESKGEKIIYDFLVQNDYNFVREYRDKRCKHKRYLPFDFAVFDEKEELKLLIEYDGELHYKVGRWADAQEKLASIKRSEKIKDEFCSRHGIALLRIPYTQFDEIKLILRGAL